MIRLLDHSIREPEAIKDLQTAQLQSIGLSSVNLCPAFVNNASVDAASGHPSGEH
jgi:hypothetical protein